MNCNNLKLYLFYCADSFGRDDLIRCCDALGEGIEVKAMSLPCSSKIDVPYLMKAFETGADAAVLIGCPTGECKHLEGFIRARKRAQAVDELLGELGLGSGRMIFLNPNGDGMGKVIEAIARFGRNLKVAQVDGGRQ